MISAVYQCLLSECERKLLIGQLTIDTCHLKQNRVISFQLKHGKRIFSSC